MFVRSSLPGAANVELRLDLKVGIRNPIRGFAGLFPKSLTHQKAAYSQMAARGLMQYKVNITGTGLRTSA